MLLRVAKSISKFPAHAVPILTSVVVACTKAGLKQSAHEYALQLMKPEYRSKIDAKFKRKIEAIIRKAQDLDEIAEPTSKCPVSSQQIPITSLECPTTQEELPMCVVTGRHVGEGGPPRLPQFSDAGAAVPLFTIHQDGGCRGSHAQSPTRPRAASRQGPARRPRPGLRQARDGVRISTDGAGEVDAFPAEWAAK